jgi:integrase
MREGFIGTKSTAGDYSIPMARLLLDELLDHHRRTRRLASSGGAQRDRSSRSVPARADATWAEHGLERRTLHIARHAYSSSLADAGVPKDLRVRCRGHADPTLDGRYAREVPGNSRPTRNSSILRRRSVSAYELAGGISWFAWMRLSGSYFDLTMQRRS